VSGAIVQYRSPRALADDLASHRDDLAVYAAQGANLDRILKGVAAAAAKNTDLLGCSKASLLTSVRQCVQLGLDPSSPLNRIHIVPFKSHAQVIVGYGGLQELALRSGHVESLDAHNVYRGERCEIHKGSEMRVDHVVDESVSHKDKDIVLTYAIAWIKGARKPIIETMTREEVEQVRSASKMRNGPAWTNSWGEMARKTAIRRIAKRLPQTPDLEAALAINDENEGLGTRRRDAEGRPRSDSAINLDARLLGGEDGGVIDEREETEIVADVESPDGTQAE